MALEGMRMEAGRDREMAVLLSERLNELGWVQISRKVETNMVWYKITDNTLNGDSLADYLK